MKIKCFCINDKGRPPEIPESHWPKFGEEYTVSMVYDLVQHGAIMGIILQELPLDELENCPYECFSIGRFGFTEQDLPALEELIQACKGLQGFDPIKLIQEEVLTGSRHTMDYPVDNDNDEDMEMDKL